MGPGVTLRLAGRLGAALSLLALAAGPGLAQSYGQWTWEASAGYGHWAFRNSLGGQSIGSWDQSDFEASLGMTGYLGHPLVGRFGLGASAALSDTSGSTAIDTRRWGYSAAVSLLPQGSYPLQLYARRQQFDYSGFAGQDPLALLQSPQDATALGGGLEVRKGWFRGIRFWVDRSVFGYAGRDETTVNQLDAVDWNRSTNSVQQRLRLEHRLQEYGLAGLRFLDYQGNYDLRRNLGSAWKWEGSASGLQRRMTYQEVDSDFGFLRLNQRAYRPLREQDTLELSYDGGFSNASGRSVQTHALLVRYHWRPGRELTVVPLLGYALQLAGGEHLNAPSAGAGLVWNRRLGGFDLGLSNQLSVLYLQRRGEGPGGSETAVAFDVGGSLGHGDQRSLRADLEGGWSHNRLRSAGDMLPELPDLGAGLSSIGTEDLLKARLTLSRQLWRILVYSYTDANRRDRDGRFANPATEARSLSQTLQLSTARVSLAGVVGATQVTAATTQEYDFVSGSASLRPFRLVSLTGTYRKDHRRLDYAPDIDGERADAGLRFWLGAFALSADAFWSRERTPGTPERENRGLVVSVRRGFGGWLPIVTAGAQGGEIR